MHRPSEPLEVEYDLTGRQLRRLPLGHRQLVTLHAHEYDWLSCYLDRPALDYLLRSGPVVHLSIVLHVANWS